MPGAVDSTVATPPAVRPGPAAKIGGYVALTKPRVVELLLVTTAPVMILAARGIPDLWLVLGTLVGGYFSAGSAHAFNSYLERDLDRKMARTSKRPLVTGVLSPREALVFAWATAVGSTLFFGLAINWLAAGLSVAAILIYVVLYTLVLKRRTPQNIVWGGAAGCMPVLIGWAAVTGSLDWAPLVLFGVVFLWTPAHYWPLSMRYREDYAAAEVPMLAVVRGRSAVGLQVVLYAWATVACSLLLIPVASMGVLYSVVAALSGAWFVVESHRLYAGAIRGDVLKPMRVFHASITYLTLVFVAVGLDPLLHLAIPF
ncbi:MAG TPA: heme o synthase [Nocardioidaceae bacterium]|nr:heme o synthase [Nocardioidaceae bacterium]